MATLRDGLAVTKTKLGNQACCTSQLYSTMTADTHTNNDPKRVDKVTERASVAEDETNGSDRSSQGSASRKMGGSGYSADCSGSASDEDEDEGPLSGSGSDDNNNNSNHRQASSIVICSGGGSSALAPVALGLPDSERKSLHESAQQGDEIPSKTASSLHSTHSSNSQDTALNDNVQQQQGIESLILGTDRAQVSQPVPSCSNKATVDTNEFQYSHHRNSVRTSRLHGPAFTKHNKSNNDSSDNSSTSESSSSGSCFTGPLLRHSMDPRIDLSVVQTAQSLHDATMLSQNQNQYNRIMDQPVMATSTQDSYHLLMEAVRPFFQDPGGPHHLSALMQQELHRSASEALSEGFTSFFSTTDRNTAANNINNIKFDRGKQDDNDHESMAVLARASRKRKHARGAAEETSTEPSGGESSGALAKKHVRIQEAQQQPATEQKQQQQMLDPIKHQLSRHVVTDVSGSSSGRNNSSSAGSGDGGNSGNDAGGKSGSSEELGAKGENRDGANDNSESASGSNEEKPKPSLVSNNTTSDSRLAAAIGETLNPPFGSTNSSSHPYQHVTVQDQGAKRERKLLDKKRRRIEMRREYEAQQQFDSSETSDFQEEYFKPGRMISMANVLVFSKIPRIVVQAKPPFLVVHTNAAYCRLTGLDSHLVVGKSICELLSIDKNSRGLNLNAEETQDSGNECITDNAKNGLSKSSLKNVTLEQLIVKSGFGQIFTVQAHRRLLHQMVGRKVTVISKNDNYLEISTDNVTGSGGEASNHGTSLASTCSGIDGDREPFPCQISIAPITSAVALNHAIDRETAFSLHSLQNCKRAKHHHDSAEEQLETDDAAQRVGRSVTKAASVPSHRKGNQTLQMVTHYVIQLHPHGVESYEGSMESISSNSASVEARLLGLSKEQLQQQRDAANVDPVEGGMLDVDDTISEATAGTKEPVAAIG